MEIIDDNEPLEMIHSDRSDLEIGDAFTRMMRAIRIDDTFENETFRETLFKRVKIEYVEGELDFPLRKDVTRYIYNKIYNWETAEIFAHAFVNNHYLGCEYSYQLQQVIESIKSNFHK